MPRLLLRAAFLVVPLCVSGCGKNDVDNDGSAAGDDCDDTRPDIAPGSYEVCGDGIDQDCSGADLSCDEVDRDGDGATPTAGDCDDADATVNPTAPEVPYDGVDQDCAAATPDDDLDGDGFDQEGGGDCNDAALGVFPGADEIPNDGIDQDCSGSDVVDVDLDGFSPVSAGGTDCDDSDVSTYPGAYEICDTGGDNNCNGSDDGCDLSGAFSLGDADFRRTGDGFSGTSVAMLGDTNDDGLSDFAHGSPGTNGVAAGSGVAYVGFGKATRLAIYGYDSVLRGEATGDNAGHAVAAAGDVNGDGKMDVLVGAWGNDAGGADAGAVYLELGPPPEFESLALADAKIIGEDADDHAGWSVAGAGDVNNDGFDDILVGAIYDDTNGTEAGAAYLLLGPKSGTIDLSLADAKLVGVAAYDAAGWRVAGAGDVNNDGFDDILVCAGFATAEDRTAVFLVHGPVSGTVQLSNAPARISGPLYKCEVAGVGDLNGDGFDDIAVGSESPGSSTGAVYVFHGPLSGVIDVSAAVATIDRVTADTYGTVSGAGDFNGDGLRDLLVGDGSASGGAALVYGPMAGVTNVSNTPYLDPAANYVWFGSEEYQSYAGSAVGGGEDVDGDGLDDLIVGAPGLGTGGGYYLWFGRGW